MNHSCISSRSRSRADDEAATWFARRDAGLAPLEEAEFGRWLAADPEHSAAWNELDRGLRLLADAPGTSLANDMILDLARRQTRRRHKVTAVLSATLATTAAVVVSLLLPGSLSPVESKSVSGVVIGQPEKRTLPDGSVAELNSDATIESSFTPERRDVRLVRGEAHFTVSRDPARPFVVSTHGVEVRAVGTAFSVAASDSVVRVLVTHGRVAVARSTEGLADASTPELIYADAGTRVSIPATAGPEVATMVPAAEVDRELAWRGPRLELSGTTLADAVVAFNREKRMKLVIADPKLAELRLSGTFRADNAEGFVRVLEANYGVTVERTESVATLRQAR